MHAPSIARVAVAGAVVQFANAALQKALISVLNAQSFHAKEIGVKILMFFTADKMKRLQEVKKIGIEEWVKKQWK